MTQTTLEEWLSRPPAVAGSDTSQAAALAIAPEAGTLRRAVLDCLRLHPEGATDEQLQVALEMNPSTERPRRVELVAGGFVVDSGERRRTRSGRLAVVWRAR